MIKKKDNLIMNEITETIIATSWGVRGNRYHQHDFLAPLKMSSVNKPKIHSQRYTAIGFFFFFFFFFL